MLSDSDAENKMPTAEAETEYCIEVAKGIYDTVHDTSMKDLTVIAGCAEMEQSSISETEHINIPSPSTTKIPSGTENEIPEGVYVTTEVQQKSSEVENVSSTSSVAKLVKYEDDPQSELPFFDLKEKVLSFHGPLLYDAIVLRRKTKMRTVREENESQSSRPSYVYFLHFHGWAKKYDEWIDEAYILKYNEQNVRVQQDLIHVIHYYDPKIGGARGGKSKSSNKTSKQKNNKQTPKSAVSPSPPEESNAPKETEETEEHEIDLSEIEEMKPLLRSVEPVDLHKRKPTIVIPMPSKLQQILFDDWVLVVQKNKLLDLPAHICVDKILEDYYEARGSIEGSAEDIFTSEIGKSFDIDIVTLIYPMEQGQFHFVDQCHADIVKGLEEDAALPTFTEIYGFAHLLRLLSSFGDLAARSIFDVDEVETLFDRLVDFLSFLEEKADNYFDPSLYSLSPNDYKGLLPQVPQANKKGVNKDTPRKVIKEEVIDMEEEQH